MRADFFKKWGLRTDQRLSLMNGAMRRMHIDPKRVATRDMGFCYTQLLRRCIACPSVELCQEWQSSQDSQLSLEEFCPNAAAFWACRKVSGV